MLDFGVILAGHGLNLIKINKMKDLILIGKFAINKVDGSVTYTELEIWKGQVTETEVFLRTVETGLHNGGSTTRETAKNYPVSFLSAFTGVYNPVTDKPEINLTILGQILSNFGITLI